MVNIIIIAMQYVMYISTIILPSDGNRPSTVGIMVVNSTTIAPDKNELTQEAEHG